MSIQHDALWVVATRPCDTPNVREIGWYLDGDLIGDTLYCPTDDELEAGAQLWLDGAA